MGHEGEHSPKSKVPRETVAVGLKKRTAHSICITILCSEKKLFVDYQTYKGIYPWLWTNLEKDIKKWRAKI